VSVTVNATSLAAGFSDTGNVNIVTNGGEASIDIIMSITSPAKRALDIGLKFAWRMKWFLLVIVLIAAAAVIIPNTILKTPVLEISPKQIDFTNVRPGDISNSTSITITNSGGKILTGTVESTKDWLVVSPTEINLPYGEAKITAYLDTKKLSYGLKDTCFIDIKTSGGNQQITVNLNTTNVIYEDDFSNSSTGWTVGSSDIGEAKYENGGYHLSTKKAGRLIAGSNRAIGQVGNFVLEVDTRSLISSRDVSYGIIFRQRNIEHFDNFYYFRISSSNGQYKLEKQLNGVSSTLKEWTDSTTINKDPSTNRLKIVCKGTQIELYANGASLAIIADASFLEGFIGLAVESKPEAESTADVIFDNIAIYSPD